MKRVSLSDIAKAAGVSKTTGSMVLNGRARENGISDATCERVWKIAKELKYKPNLMARGLRLGKTHTLGLIVADISNDFFAQIARTVEETATRYGYHVIFCNSDENAEKLTELIQTLKTRQVDGLIISPALHDYDNEISRLKREKFPFVLIDRYFSKINTNYVVVNNFEASFQATSLLLDRGYNRIGIIAVFSNSIQHKLRVDGYREALKQNGIRFLRKFVVEVSYGNLKESIINAIRKLLDCPNNVRAIYFLNNRVAVIGLECINEMNLRIPKDIDVLSFDDNEVFRLFDPPITAVAQPVHEIAEKAVSILIDEIERPKKISETRQIVLPAKLIKR